MPKKITVFTGSRAEYGLLYWLIKDIKADPELELQLLVSGMHLSPEFGNTHTFIEKDGFKIDKKVEMLLSTDTPTGIAKSMGMGIIGFSDALSDLTPDAIVILGDRFEALAIAQTAMILRIPILHIHGGELTEGAYDDSIRHAITKLSYFHCTAAEVYRQRVIQLGESPERVLNVGAIGLDHIALTSLPSLTELSNFLDFQIDKPYMVVTYHPETLGKESTTTSLMALLESLDDFPDHQVILTYPNADDDGRKIIPLLESYANKQPHRVILKSTLGQKNYLSAIKHASVVVGNSSSGIIEVPSFQVPTVNIGNRQKGRLAAESVLHCPPEKTAITSAIKIALKNNCSNNKSQTVNPYGQGNASAKVISALKIMPATPEKSFYDMIVE